MRAIGLVLLVSGWLIVLAALMLLVGIGERFAFGAAGLGVEALGLGMLTAAYRADFLGSIQPTEGRRR